MTEWVPGHWWRLTSRTGVLKAETSNYDEIRKFYVEGDLLERLFITTDEKWIVQAAPDPLEGPQKAQDSPIGEAQEILLPPILRSGDA